MRRSSVSSSGRLRSAIELGLAIRRVVTSGNADVIHLHSSLAGLVGRLVLLTCRRDKTKVFYSPHGFAFLRQDVSRGARSLYLTVERILARLGDGNILASESEYRLSKEHVSISAPAAVLQNSIAMENLPQRLPRGDRPLRVAMVGRVTYQKAPWRFANAAKRLENLAEFIWIGDGDRTSVGRWLEDSPVDVKGWMAKSEVRATLADVDILYFPTLWEGMPMALIEAQAIGVPAVASNIVGNIDAILHNVTGYVGDTEEELLGHLEHLLTDRALIEKMSIASRHRARQTFNGNTIGVRSLQCYSATSSQ